ncbi:oligosaccharide flippase family protein [Desulfonema magnum]|uniref:Polysaccharide biosynthesis protein n=1 Tax=Desulfonema magnum TaxID=45655 RepID=A0A975BRS6_9BACT|nr:oligosaccharide flippase family protein [Desulfonema magnum]QTA90024.1 Putative polysaccharide biosynthesis protein [Desulfonema magnum]
MVKTKKDTFAGNIAKLMVGNATAQVISILVIPIVTRLFSPDDYGIFSLYLSITVLFTLTSSLSYVSAILLPKNDIEASNVFGLTVLTVTGVSFLVCIIVLLGGKQVCHYFNITQVESYLWILPASIFIDGIYSALNYWSLRKKRFTQLSLSKIVATSCDKCLSLCCGLLGYVHASILIVSRLIGVFFSILTLGHAIWKKDRDAIKSSITIVKISQSAKRYRKFPLISNWSVLLGNISRQVPIIMIAIFFSPDIVGIYALTTRVLGMPMKLIGDAIFRVFFQKIAELKNQGKELGDISLKLLTYLISIVVVPIAFISIIGREVFIILFGNTWVLAGTFAQILCFVYLFTFISRPFFAFFNVLERQEVRFYFDSAFLIVRICSLFIGGLMDNVLLAMILYSICSIIIYLICIFWLFDLVDASYRKTFVVLFHSVLFSLPFIGTLVLLKFGFQYSPIFLMLSSGIMTLIYYILIIYRDDKLKGLLRLRQYASE